MNSPTNDDLKREVADLRQSVHELTKSVSELTNAVKDQQRVTSEHHTRISDAEATLYGKNPKGIDNDSESVVGLIRNLNAQARLLKWALGFFFGGGLMTLVGALAWISQHIK